MGRYIDIDKLSRGYLESHITLDELKSYISEISDSSVTFQNLSNESGFINFSVGETKYSLFHMFTNTDDVLFYAEPFKPVFEHKETLYISLDDSQRDMLKELVESLGGYTLFNNQWEHFPAKMIVFER